MPLQTATPRSRSISPQSRSDRSLSTRSTSRPINAPRMCHQDFLPPPPHPFAPDAIPAWQNALNVVDTRPARLVDASFRDSTDGKTVFPLPKLFLNVGAHRQARYFTTWAGIRDACVYRVLDINSQPQPLKMQDWRDLLWGSQNENASRLSAIFSKSFSVGHVDYLALIKQPPVSLTDITTIRRMVWELYELNFRWQLQLLDQRIRRHDIDPHHHDERLHSALKTPGLFSFDFTQSSLGLASPVGSETLFAALVSFRDLVQEWQGVRPPQLQYTGDNYTEAEIRHLEDALARYYCQTFYNNFGTCPSIPYRL